MFKHVLVFKIALPKNVSNFRNNKNKLFYQTDIFIFSDEIRLGK